jgi:hypothetical protein
VVPKDWVIAYTDLVVIDSNQSFYLSFILMNELLDIQLIFHFSIDLHKHFRPLLDLYVLRSNYCSAIVLYKHLLCDDRYRPD